MVGAQVLPLDSLLAHQGKTCIRECGGCHDIVRSTQLSRSLWAGAGAFVLYPGARADARGRREKNFARGAAPAVRIPATVSGLPPPPAPQLSPDGKFWWNGEAWQPYPSGSAPQTVHPKAMRLLSCKPKRNGAEFWFVDTTVDDVADLFLRFFVSQGFRLGSGSAVDGQYDRKRGWASSDWYRVKIKSEAKSVHATITGPWVSKRGMVPLRYDLVGFPNQPAELQQSPVEQGATPFSGAPESAPKPNAGPKGTAKPTTVPVTNDLLIFLNDPVNLEQVPTGFPPASLQAGGLPRPKSTASGWSQIVALGTLTLIGVMALVLWHAGAFKSLTTGSAADPAAPVPSASVTKWQLNSCRASTKGYITGYFNCTGSVTVSIPSPITTDTVSVSLPFPDSGSFYHGSYQVGSGFAGVVTVPIVNDYEPKCYSGEFPRTITVYDGPADAPASEIATAQVTVGWRCG